MRKWLQVVAGAIALGFLGVGTAGASPIGLMLEADADADAGSELLFATVPTYADLLAFTNFNIQFSQVNVAGSFTTTGITWDGSQFVLMLEADADADAGSELLFATVPTYADLLAFTNFNIQFSQVNVAGSFTTTGLWTMSDPSTVPLPASGWLTAEALMLLMVSRWGRRRRFARVGG